MKALKTLILTFLIAMSIPASAQKIPQMIDQAYDDFVSSLLKDDYITVSQSESYTNGYFKSYAFSIPQKKGKAFDQFNLQMKQNNDNAYSTLLKKAGSKADNTISIGYGEDNSKTYKFGTHSDRNYLVEVFYSTKDSTMRTAYALVWQDSNDSILGSVYKFYGKNPAKATKVFSFLEHPEARIGSDGSVLLDGKKILNLNSAGVIYPNDDADFIQQYTNLSTIFTTNIRDFDKFKTSALADSNSISKRVSLITGAANKIMQMCKEYGKLNKDDREIVKADLARLSSFCTGDFASLYSLFMSAQKALK